MVEYGSSLTFKPNPGSAALADTDYDGLLNEDLLLAYGVDGRWEIMAAQNVVDNMDGTYTIDTFLRGLRGTEQYTGTHAVDDYLVWLDDPDNGFVGKSLDDYLETLMYRPASKGYGLDAAPVQELTYNAINLKPLSPVDARGYRDGSNNITCLFIRRDRVDAGWNNFLDIPMSEESLAFEIDIVNGSIGVVRTISTTVESFIYTAAEQIEDFGSTQSSVDIHIFQLSAAIGRGYPLEATI